MTEPVNFFLQFFSVFRPGPEFPKSQKGPETQQIANFLAVVVIPGGGSDLLLFGAISVILWLFWPCFGHFGDFGAFRPLAGTFWSSLVASASFWPSLSNLAGVLSLHSPKQLKLIVTRSEYTTYPDPLMG